MTFRLFKWEPDWFEQADALDKIAPDWEMELQKAIVSKDAFVAMTMGCKVDIVTKVSKAVGLSEAGSSIVSTTYSKRWHIINNNIPDGPSPDGYGRRSIYYCLLKEATLLAYNLGWQLPKPMLRLIPPELRKNKALPRKSPQSNRQWRKAFEYESEGLSALYELIEKYFFDADGHPIYDKKKLPVKKTLESDFFKLRRLSEADSIITSGKRRGKAEK